MTNPDNVGGLFYPSGDDVDQMIELAIQCGIDNRGTSWPVTLCRLRAKLRALLARTEAAPVADGAVPLWISCHWREDLARDSVVSVVNRQDPAHTLQVYVSTHPHDASARDAWAVEGETNGAEHA